MFVSLQYADIDNYFWKAEVPLVRHLRITTNDAQKVISPISYTSIYFDVDVPHDDQDDQFYFFVDCDAGPEVITAFVPSGMSVRIDKSSTNRFIMSAGTTNTSIDRVIQVRNIGPSTYLMTELRTQFPEETIFRVKTQGENK